MTYRKNDKRSHLVRLVDDLIGMFPDPYDRKGHRKIKKNLESLEYSINDLKEYKEYFIKYPLLKDLLYYNIEKLK